MNSSDLQDNYRDVFDGHLGFGARPAVLVVDFVKGYTTPGAPLYAPDVVTAVAETTELIELARRQGVPVIYTRVVYHPSGIDGGLWVKKIPVLRTLTEGSEAAALAEGLEALPDELVLVKQYASAFFGTSLASTLSALGVDTLILTGCSTSGCVRATAVDGMQHGLRVVVPQECVGDRHPEPHQAALFDIHSKYGDVVPKALVADYLFSTQGVSS
ncbi:MAG: isochorismatase family protein [Myxococcota bacterium]|nr:isochorismatase family protein [Myxococcota bacterium]